jgi:hypothetical protein
MEPTLKTDPNLIGVLEELKRREPIFHHEDEFGTSQTDIENQMEGCFWEVGASGSCYSRSYVTEHLLARYSKPYEDIWEASDFHCLEIAKDNYLLTYTLIQNNTRVTRRSTIWRRSSTGWKIVYHQGTVVQEGCLNETVNTNWKPAAG